MPFNTFKKFVNISPTANIGRLLAMHIAPDHTADELIDEATGVMRGFRRLRPNEDDNFSLNEVSMLDQVLDNVFASLNIAAFVIGIFALIVGMFSVANIMFVSVRERTSLIGIKKALGAKRNIILIEFLVEAIILCLIGGVMGLLFAGITLKVISSVIPFKMGLNFMNMVTGVGVSVFVGIIAGIIPAWLAARMDPVVAIRS